MTVIGISNLLHLNHAIVLTRGTGVIIFLSRVSRPFHGFDDA